MKETHDGRPIYEFTLPRDAVVFMDVHVPMRPADIERLARGLRGRRSGASADGDASTAAAAPNLGWLCLAAAVGYAVGEVLDDLAGSNDGGNDNLSDDLSDWAADKFPAPDWLKDLGA